MKPDRDTLTKLIYQSLIEEVRSTPKPGLVDLVDNGAHKDMNVEMFEASSAAIAPFLADMAETGFEAENLTSIFSQIRKIGLEAEKAMYAATGGINTHKGAIFTLGVILAGYGWLTKDRKPSVSEILDTVRQMCADTLIKELSEADRSNTKGMKLYLKYGERGIRGQCIEGYPVILKAYETYTKSMGDETQRRLKALLVSISLLSDTNVISRSSYETLEILQKKAREILDNWDEGWYRRLTELNDFCIAENVSPGGGADVLAAVLLLDSLMKCEINF